MGISLEEAQKLIAMYFKQFPLIQKYVEDSHLMAEKNFFVMNEFGQRKQQFGAMPMFKRTAVYNAAKRNAQNVRVQSTASTLGLYAFANLNGEMKKLGGRALSTVYDSVEFEVPRARAAEAFELCFYCLDDWPVEVLPWLDLPIGCDGEIGFNWGNQRKLKRGCTQDDIENALQLLAA